MIFLPNALMSRGGGGCLIFGGRCRTRCGCNAKRNVLVLVIVLAVVTAAADAAVVVASRLLLLKQCF